MERDTTVHSRDSTSQTAAPGISRPAAVLCSMSPVL